MNPALQAFIINFILPEFLGWMKRRQSKPEVVAPDVNGNCPAGYTKSDADQLCHLDMPTKEQLAAELNLTTSTSIAEGVKWLAEHPAGEVPPPPSQ